MNMKLFIKQTSETIIIEMMKGGREWTEVNSIEYKNVTFKVDWKCG